MPSTLSPGMPKAGARSARRWSGDISRIEALIA